MSADDLDRVIDVVLDKSIRGKYSQWDTAEENEYKTREQIAARIRERFER